jgi:hypothetical protein
VLLSLIPEKKARYMMPVLIPLAINTGFYIYYILKEFGTLKKRFETIPVYFHFGLLGLAGMAFPLVAFYFFNEQIMANLNLFLPLGICLFLSGSFLFFSLYNKKMFPAFYLSISVFVLLLIMAVPLNPGFANQNINYRSISPLKEEAEKENIRVYVLDLISPEMLWDFGGIIPTITKNESGYILPGEDKFGVLVNDPAIINTAEFSSEYIIEKREVYDLNTGKYNTKKHKPRYVSNYYIFKKKNID